MAEAGTVQLEVVEHRNAIIKNSILMNILKGCLLKEENIVVASTIRGIHEETEKIMKDDNKKSIPSYCQYDIVIGEMLAKIGIRYKESRKNGREHPIIWVEETEERNPKVISEYVFRKFNINASKVDEIFRSIPEYFFRYLSENGYSPRYWTLGISEKTELRGLPKASTTKEKSLNDKEMAFYEYVRDLKQTYHVYRAFAKILIDIYHNKKCLYKNACANILEVCKSSTPGEICVTFDDNEEMHHFGSSVLISNFDPKKWYNRDISIFDITNVVSWILDEEKK
jgi:hypothetical protein